MRYLHDRADGIVRYVEAQGLTVTRCDRNGVTRPVPASAAAIAELLEATRHLGGALLPYYLWVASAPREQAPKQDAAIAEVQAPQAQAFLLVGYDDGGAVSISNRKLAFQAGARPADWWQP